MNYKQQEKAFNIALNTMDKQFSSIISSNIDLNMLDELSDLVTKNCINTIQNIFPTATINQINYIINNHFNHILELKFNEFYNLLNNIEIINQVR